MKRAAFFFLLFATAYFAEAQKSMTTKEYSIGERRRGFVGLSVGAAIPVGDFSSDGLGRAETGIRADANFGYLFTENLGITAEVYYGNHDFIEQANNPESTNWKYYGVMAGPLISGIVHRNIEWVGHPLIGFSLANYPQPDEDKKSVQSNVALAVGLGTGLHFNFFSRVGFNVGFDYYYTKVKFGESNNARRISTFTPSLGVAYRFH